MTTNQKVEYVNLGANHGVGRVFNFKGGRFCVSTYEEILQEMRGRWELCLNLQVIDHARATGLV